ncbi:hypothetical protein [Eubacterium callanderi]|uniref:hypothetical protein n=1 Tax=Eubacterium callanderi TaxID=53442 RepID=UPI0008EDD2AF|nr:hypothetical protein [Eubacterium callanderi]MCB6661608.1 hypothetical protein [Eubacterium callanderi]MCB6754520.1 hypothetical protein [Eubacterium callanderi]MCB7106211.1 hypothetical protein [Eubacterium callanderi]MCG4821551.1 hypothetical protein [Eubacterium callanderi]MCQ5191861.1 hypothetical protein [Eubacterium callanderi]
MGQTLTANIDPADATATYQWKVADSAGGSYSNIPEATNKTLILSAEQQGKFIKVEATGTGKFEGTKLSAATAAVAPQA